MTVSRPRLSTTSHTSGRTPGHTPGRAAGPTAAGDTAASPAGFAAFGLPTALVDALTSAGITEPFPIQSGTLPHALSGRDVLGRGRTGSGKTYAFLLPLVTRLAASRSPRGAGHQRPPRGLVLAPTRELALQIETALQPLAAALSLRAATVFGGVPAGRQIKALAEGLDIVIACPGRLTDLVRSGHADLSRVEVTVLDEADHMADLGFLPDVRRLLDRTPENGQRLLFSATLDAGVDVLVKRYLHDPVVHSVDSAQSPVSTMAHHVLKVDAGSRMRVLTDLAAAPGRTLIFTRTKHGAKGLTRKLNAAGVEAVELHGNLSQGARTRNLARFSTGAAQTLVATDIAARGIHVDDVALVVHADPPVEHKAYLHRSGRTARAGASGTVVTLVLDSQRAEVQQMTRKAGITPTVTTVDTDHPLLRVLAPGDRHYGEPVVAAATSATAPAPSGRGSRGFGSPRRGGRQGSAPAGAPAARRRQDTGTRGGSAVHSAAGFSGGGQRRGR